MNVCVLGLWHLGSVTAACLATAGFSVIGGDDDAAVVNSLTDGKAPLFEPGLDELLATGIASGNLRFTSDLAAAVRDADLVWVAWDTPVDDDDRADVAFVTQRVESVLPYLRDGATLLISSQVPVGTTDALAARYRELRPGCVCGFAYSPENLRLGKALDAFRKPERIIVGVDGDGARSAIAPVLAPFCDNILWVSVPSAEMSKHALNAYLATCVTFINELAVICENVGADAGEVERALRSEPRVGPKAYIRPGASFAGGTLARDVTFLAGMQHDLHLPGKMFDAVLSSNVAHKLWPLERLRKELGGLAGRRVALLGLAYRPGTDTLRRSAAVELAQVLVQEGAQVRAFDPAVASVPAELVKTITVCDSVETALASADAVVVMTEWPEFRNIAPACVLASMARALVIDPNRFVEKNLGGGGGIRWVTVGAAEG